MVSPLGIQEEEKLPESMREGTANVASRKVGLSGCIRLVSVHALMHILYIKKIMGMKRVPLYSTWNYKMNVGKRIRSFYSVLKEHRCTK